MSETEQLVDRSARMKPDRERDTVMEKDDVVSTLSGLVYEARGHRRERSRSGSGDDA